MAVKRKSNKAMNEVEEEVKTGVGAASGVNGGAAEDKSKTAGRAAMMDGADVEEVTTGKAVMTDGADVEEVATGRAAMMDGADVEEVTTGEVVMTDGDDGAEVAGGVSDCAGGKVTSGGAERMKTGVRVAKDKSKAAEEGKAAKGKAGGQKTVSAISPALVGAVCTALRNGLSLYAACRASGVDTRVFYQALADNPAAREAYRLALADYADRCTDAIRQIVAELRAGEIDNPTAKLLIETEKWLAQKACPEAVQESFLEEEERDGVKEIVVHFV